MNTWFAIHRSPETASLLRDHPNAMLLLLQILCRARWQKKKCPKTGLEHGQAFIGDWRSAGLPSEKAYRNAKGILERGGACTFQGAKLGAEQKAELGAEQKANRGTIATVRESAIYTFGKPSEGGAKGGAKGGAEGELPGGASSLTGATNIQAIVKDSTSSAPALPEEAAFWNTFPKLPRVLSFAPKRHSALKRMRAIPEWQDRWQEAIRRLAASSFATGGGETGWKADIDFLLSPSGFERTLSGKYDDRRPAPRPETISARDFSVNTPSSARDFSL